MKRLFMLVLVSGLIGACADKGSTDAADRASNTADKPTSSPSADVKRVLIESLDKDLAPAAGDPGSTAPAPGEASRRDRTPSGPGGDDPAADPRAPAAAGDASLDEAEAADQKFLSVFGGPQRRTAPRRVAKVRPRPRRTGEAAKPTRTEKPVRNKAAEPASPGTVSKLRHYELDAITPGSGPRSSRKRSEKPKAKPTDKRVHDAYSGARGLIDSLGEANRAAAPSSKSERPARKEVKRTPKPRDTARRQSPGTLDEADQADDEVLKVLGGN